MDFVELLDRLHAGLRPDAYLEIGVDIGQCLALSRAHTIAIDPHVLPHYPSALLGKPWLKFFRATSDAFFRDFTPEATLAGHTLDLAFIDGLHQFTQVVRDLENVERWGHPDTVVVVHDVLPPDPWQASRAFHEGPWTGDVWRLVPFLREHRPDLRLALVDVPPSGVLVVTGIDPAHPGMADRAEAIDRDFPPDGPNYERLVAEWIANADPIGPEAALRALRPPTPGIDHRIEGIGWDRAAHGWVATDDSALGELRIVPGEPLRGSHRARLTLAAQGMEVLRIRLQIAAPEGAQWRDIHLDVTHPGTLHHELDSLWLDVDVDRDARAFTLDWECGLTTQEALTAIAITPDDYWLWNSGQVKGMTIEPRHVELQSIAWPREGNRFTPERFPGRPLPPKRLHGKRDAVIFAWWAPANPEAQKVGEYYLGLLRYHHPDSKIFVGLNHGSDPAWIRALDESGLDIELCIVDPAIVVNSDVAGFLAALDAFSRDPETFDLVWFGHSKGASRPSYSDDARYRYEHERRFWSRRAEIDRLFADPKIGLFAHRYGLHHAGNPEAVPGRGFVELDALERIYRHEYAPLGLWAWETVYVMRDAIVRAFCQSVDPEFFRANPAAYGAGRWLFEAAFPSIASMQGYEPAIELDTDGAGDPRDDVLLMHDPRQGNRLALEELRRWREAPYTFEPRELPRVFE